MSWLFSQALVEAFSEASSLDGAPCAPLSVMPTPHKFWRNDKTMECSNLSQFGLTCAVLTEGHGAELLMSFLEASPARTSAPQGRAQGLTESDPAFGLRWPGSFARFDPASSSWKTPQCSLLEGLDEFSETWPRWGSMRNGECWGRTIPEPRTNGTESGSWVDPETGRLEHFIPTPMANNLPRSPKARDIHKSSPRLVDFIRANPSQMLATPTATANQLAPSMMKHPGCRLIHAWPTPNAGDFKAGMSNSQNRQQSSLPRTVGIVEGVSTGKRGGLNPTFPEWLMGWPINWTALKPSATVKFPSAPPSHGTRCFEDWLAINHRMLETIS